ncbi:bacterioferritin family protein [Desulfocucumis palustris]|uniref:Bacterioferritin family protein n=1 Tax=Desulfocucumis palustris TaxID=1898651 RepID=A0A2L2X7B9_9FIRM|nr:manganese catalase family protein [Desulfocucumis palustris]GBF32079.1 bacterioferritin family protein [Desulfocucumis palustris]
MSGEFKGENMGVGQEPHHNRWCALPEPYPEPGVVRPNHFYAMLLLEDYVGTVSEMTAVNQYFYHHLTFEKYDDLAELEICISIVEMHHLELLGKTIKLLGVAPEFRTLSNNRPVYWNAAYVYYGKNVCDKLAADIAAEKKAIQQYGQHKQLIDDPYIKELLERIIKDEEYHLKLFSDAAAKYCPGIK